MESWLKLGKLVEKMFPPLPWGGRWLRPQPFRFLFCDFLLSVCPYARLLFFLLYPCLLLWASVCSMVLYLFKNQACFRRSTVFTVSESAGGTGSSCILLHVAVNKPSTCILMYIAAKTTVWGQSHRTGWGGAYRIRQGGWPRVSPILRLRPGGWGRGPWGRSQ